MCNPCPRTPVTYVPGPYKGEGSAALVYELYELTEEEIAIVEGRV
jgi:hypothetical protein